VCVTECDHETSKLRRPWPSTGCCAMGKKELREGGREIKEGRKNRVKEN
jgi:hypothetical protein